MTSLLRFIRGAGWRLSLGLFAPVLALSVLVVAGLQLTPGMVLAVFVGGEVGRAIAEEVEARRIRRDIEARLALWARTNR